MCERSPDLGLGLRLQLQVCVSGKYLKLDEQIIAALDWLSLLYFIKELPHPVRKVVSSKCALGVSPDESRNAKVANSAPRFAQRQRL